jgi:hypothetical protein
MQLKVDQDGRLLSGSQKLKRALVRSDYIAVASLRQPRDESTCLKPCWCKNSVGLRRLSARVRRSDRRAGGVAVHHVRSRCGHRGGQFHRRGICDLRRRNCACILQDSRRRPTAYARRSGRRGGNEGVRHEDNPYALRVERRCVRSPRRVYANDSDVLCSPYVSPFLHDKGAETTQLDYRAAPTQAQSNVS